MQKYFENRGIRFMGRYLILLVFVCASSAGAVDLLDVYKEAVSRDANYAAAKAQYLAIQERIPQAKSGKLPKINLQAKYDYNNIDADSAFSQGNRDFGSYQYGVTGVQPLYRKQNDIAIDIAQKEVLRANIQLDLAGQQLMVRTLWLYIDALKARTNLGTVRAQKLAVTEQLELAKRNFAVGTATITDQREAQARFDLVRAEELAAQNQVQVTLDALQELTGSPIKGNLAPLKMPVSLDAPMPADVNVWIKRAMEQSLEIALSQHDISIAQSRVEINQYGKSPTVDLVGSVVDAYAGNSTFGSGSDTTSGVVGVQVQVPLFEGGKVNAQTREAIAQQDQMLQLLEYTKRKVAQDTRVAYLDVTTGISRVKAFEEALASTKLQLESTKLGLEVGVRTAVDVLDAEKLLAESRRDMFGAVYDTIFARFKLQATVGRLVEADVAAINELLVR